MITSPVPVAEIPPKVLSAYVPQPTFKILFLKKLKKNLKKFLQLVHLQHGQI
jgi:hypothetical protein